MTLKMRGIWGLFVVLGLSGCATTPQEPERPVNPEITLGVNQIKSQGLIEAFESTLDRANVAIDGNENVLILTGCTKRGLEKLSTEALRSYYSAVDRKTNGRVLVGCWDNPSRRLRSYQNAGHKPFWDPSKCGVRTVEDAKGKKWVMPEALFAEDPKCGLPKVDALHVFKNTSASELGVLEGLLGVLPPKENNRVKMITDLLEIRQMIPPITSVVLVHDNFFGISRDPLVSELFSRHLHNDGGAIWFHPTIEALNSWTDYDLSQPLIKMDLPEELDPEVQAELHVTQMVLENPIKIRGVPLEEDIKEMKKNKIKNTPKVEP